MKIKTSELTGQALDWAVAKCEGGIYQGPSVRDSFWMWPGKPVKYSKQAPSYSTNWAQGGPLIESERIAVWATTDGWKAQRSDTSNLTTAPTPLIAAMRCYVASKLGNEVEIPEELT